MNRPTHRAPVVLTQRGRNLLDGLIVWGLTIGLGLFGAVLLFLVYNT